jgi:hypothetical protein
MQSRVFTNRKEDRQNISKDPTSAVFFFNYWQFALADVIVNTEET